MNTAADRKPRCTSLSTRLGQVVGLLALALSLLVSPASAQESPTVMVLTFDGAVTPILVSYVERGIREAEASGATALVLRLDTPGGQVNLTQDLVKRMRASRVPIIVYVWPEGAMAGSAGTFITLAGHVAAMVPGSTIGAASPIDASGADLDETSKAKATNILAAEVENLARRRGAEAAQWARLAVEEAAAATANEALELGVIDAVAPDLETLLQQVDGLTIDLDGQPVTLNLAQAQIREEPMSGLEEFLDTLINALVLPGIAVLLIVLGVQAIIGEFSQPGGYVAGVVGLVSVLLGLYALGILNANWAGLAFIALAFILFIVDIKVQSHGALLVAGLASLVFGSVVLFSGTEVEVPWATIIGLAVFTALFFTFVIAKVVSAQRKRPVWGMESLVGARGVTRTTLHPAGKVLVQGELWSARLEEGGLDLPEGALVEVAGLDGLNLLVRPGKGQA